jgi:hypothetical protein
MKKLLVTRDRQKSTEQGFSIAVSTGFGLIIMMIGLTMMGRAMKDSSVSAAQKAITRSDAAAQVGVTRYLGLISKYPVLAGVRDCVSRATSGACNDTGTTKSWANSAAFSSSELSAAGKTAAQAAATTNWIDIDSGNTAKGQFKLASYTPPASGTAGQGTVLMDGRVGQTGTGNGATTSVQTANSQSNAAIAFTPATTGTGSATVSTLSYQPIGAAAETIKFPGLWLRQGPGSIGQYFRADGLLENTSTADLYTYRKNDDGTFKTALEVAPRTNLRIADFLPTQVTALVTSSTPVVSTTPVLNDLGNITTDLTLPRSAVTAPCGSGTPADTYSLETIEGKPTKVYRYKVSSMTANNTNIIVNTINRTASTNSTNPAQKVIFYLDGNIDPGGNGDITHQCGTGACDLNNFIIYGYKTITPATTTPIVKKGVTTGYTTTPAIYPKICSHGQHQIQAFIIAPQYTVGGNASGGGQGGFQGAVWANQWGGDCANTTSNQLMVQQNGIWDNVANWGSTEMKITTQPATTTLVAGTGTGSGTGTAASISRRTPTPASTSAP